MSVKTIFRQGSITQKRFKDLGKIVGIGLFTLLMLTNIKLALLDDNEIANGDISVLGIEINLFDATYGEPTGNKLKAKVCRKKDGSIGSKTTCDNPDGSYCLPGQGSGICT